MNSLPRLYQHLLIYCSPNVGERLRFVNLNITDWTKLAGFKIPNDAGFAN